MAPFTSSFINYAVNNSNIEETVEHARRLPFNTLKKLKGCIKFEERNLTARRSILFGSSSYLLWLELFFAFCIFCIFFLQYMLPI